MTRFAPLASLIALSALLAGCPIYVDDHGGSDCIGLGCSPDPECATHAECDGNELCQAGTCVDTATCRTDGDCGAGFRCADGQCAQSPVCDDDNDCTGGLVCGGNGTARTCVEPSGCRSNADCTSGDLCVEGACVDPSETCQFNYQCGAGRACVDNSCVNLCDTNEDCPSGHACDRGFCEPASECTTTADCDGGTHCVRGQCLADCRANPGICGQGEVCRSSDGFCHPDSAPRPFCTSDAQCADDHVCRDGVCRTPCPTMSNNECQMFDVQLPRCAVVSGSEYLCYAQNERNPECALQSDCNDTQSCIDAVCRNR